MNHLLFIEFLLLSLKISDQIILASLIRLTSLNEPSLVQPLTSHVQTFSNHTLYVSSVRAKKITQNFYFHAHTSSSIKAEKIDSHDYCCASVYKQQLQYELLTYLLALNREMKILLHFNHESNLCTILFYFISPSHSLFHSL